MKDFFHNAFSAQIVIRSIKVALVVGTLLNLINQGDLLLNMNFDKINYIKLGLTYCVPYMVATYAGAMVRKE